MKNNKNKTAVKEARKALKKQLNDKLFAQIKTIVSEFEADSKKVGKAIEKASKNLAKILSAKINTDGDAPAAAVKVVKDKKQNAESAESADKTVVAPATKTAADKKPAIAPSKTVKAASKTTAKMPVA